MDNKENPKVMTPLGRVLLLGCIVIWTALAFHFQELIFNSNPPYLLIASYGIFWIVQINRTIRYGIIFFRAWRNTPKEPGRFRRVLRENRFIIYHIFQIATLAMSTFMIYDSYVWRQHYRLYGYLP